MWLAHAAETPTCTRSFESLGTQASLELVGEESACASALTIVQKVFADVNERMSPWVAGSDVNRINRAAGEPGFVRIAPSTFAVLQAARRLSESTDGLFDITFAVAAHLWESGAKEPPDERKVIRALGLVGYKHVQLDPSTQGARIDRAGPQLSLNGIAKGYAVDQAVIALRAAGVHHFVLRAGGDLYASGRRGVRQWLIGIRDPRSSEKTFAMLPIEDAAFSTSGDYERGKHIIDPRTARPALVSRSVTILAADCTTAEGLSKAIFVAGPQEMNRILARFAGTGAVVVDAENEVHVSPALVRVLLRSAPPTP